MPRLRLVDDGYPFKKIMQGSKWIGRVYKNAQGTWTGQIGKNASRYEVTAATDREAFMEVGARYLGQPNAAALHAHNSAVRSSIRQRRATYRNADELLRDLLRRITGNDDVEDVTVRRNFLHRLNANRAERARNNDGLSNEALQEQVDAEREVNRLEQELSEDDFVPPRGRQH